MANRGRKYKPPILYLAVTGNYGELRSIGAQDDSDYYNPNPWATILGRASETDVEIDEIVSKALIDSGAMILMMSKDYCYEHGYEIQPMEHLVTIKGSGGASVCYLGYVENAHPWNSFL